MRYVQIIVFFLLIAFTFHVNAQEDMIDISLSGEWEITRETPKGKKSVAITMAHEGSKATVWSKNGEYTITLKGNRVHWEQQVKTPMGKMKAIHQGTIESENRLSGTFVFDDGPLTGRQMKWTAKRKLE